MRLPDHPPFEITTNYVAAGAATYPVWHKWLEWTSAEAAIWMPILGVLFLIMQIVFRIITWNKRK